MEGQTVQLNSQNYNTLLMELPWIEVTDRTQAVSRSSCLMVEKDCICSCKYGRGKPWKGTQWPEWIKNIAKALEVFLNLPLNSFNSCNGNRYATASEQLQWHNDNESLFIEDAFKRDVLIASLSFGVSREFCIRKNYGKTLSPVLLEDGDLLTMDGLMQETHEHCVRASPNTIKQANEIDKVRYNLTFRIIKKHLKGCPQCS